ncbi:MAG: DNA polymerase IV [Coriobacteriales bacterium]|jgi:DNA polymerase-4|nr:DNA polymerase IV [Coriobacteriales bacterium]
MSDRQTKRTKPTDEDVELLIPWEGQAVLLLDLDAFFASVEQLDHPEWRGKPVIVGGDSARRGVVSTCSYEARAFGVRSAMPSSHAARLCPNAIWTPGNFPRYISLSKQVMKIMSDVSPRLQQVSIDEAFLDVSPGRFVKDHPITLANRIREEVSRLGVTCSIGLGTSKSVAKIASDMDKPNGLTVVFPGRELDFLSPLPIRTMSGVGRQAEKRLHELGIYTLGELANSDDYILHQVFGKNATMMRNRCLGINDSAVESDDEVKSVSNELTFATNLTERTEIEQSIAMLAAKVARRLRRKRLAGYTVGLKVRYDDLSIANAQQTLPRPVDDENEFIPALFSLIDNVWRPGTSLRLVGVAVSSFGQKPEQLSLFDDIESAPGNPQKPPVNTGRPTGQKTGIMGRRTASHLTGQPSPHKANRRSLVEATDRVKDRFGEEAVGYGREMRFRDRDTGTIAQKKDDYKDPLHPE